MIKGIDISRWQGIINWDAVKNATVDTGEKVEFAVVKAGGSDDGFYPDGQFVRNAEAVRRLEIPHGFYVYLGGVSSVENEVQHIKNLVNMIGGLHPGESIWLDWEESNADEVGYVTGIAKGLIDAGFPKPGIYMSLSRVKSKDWKRAVELNSGLWVAAWGDNDAAAESNEVPGSEEWPFWAIWQYSSVGSVQGIGGRVDLDQFNGDAATFLKYGASGAIAPPAPQPVTQPAPAPNTDAEYTVKSGENLSVIAARYGHTWQELWELNRDRVSNPNRVFPNQVLRIWGSTPAPQQTRSYTVKSGDNLTAIGAKLGIDWRTLYNNNKGVIGPDPNFIKAGQELRY